MNILALFRRYRVGPAEMLFLNPNDCKLPANRFRSAMRSLLEKGLVVSERPDQAYSLTPAGYQYSLRVREDATSA
jgi:hypothetical protein